MLYGDLLRKEWKDIAEASHERARRLAFDAGTRAAEQAIADSGSEILRFLSDTDLRDFFFSHLIKTEDFWDQLSECEEKYWEKLSNQPYPSDPRVQAFGDAWLYFMETELARDFPKLPPEKLHRRYLTGMRPEALVQRAASEAESNTTQNSHDLNPFGKTGGISTIFERNQQQETLNQADRE